MAIVYVSQTGTPVVGSRYVGTTHQAIKDAIAYLVTQGGGKVHIEKGVYIINDPSETTYGIVVRNSNIEICGDGNKTILKPAFTGGGIKAVISFIGTLNAELENVYVHDLFIGNNADAAIGAQGIYADYVGRSVRSHLDCISPEGTFGVNSVAGATGFTLGSNEGTVEDLNGKYIMTIEGAGKPESRQIVSYNPATKTGTGSPSVAGVAWNTPPTTSHKYRILNREVPLSVAYDEKDFSGLTIKNVTLRYNATDGITFLRCGACDIINNKIQYSGARGILVGNYCHGFKILRNKVDNSASYGIACIGVYATKNNGHVISKNNVTNGGSTGITCTYCVDIIVTSNISRNNAGRGIDVSFCNNILISGNMCSNNVMMGIIAASALEIVIFNNVCQANNNAGIGVQSSSYINMTGNNCNHNAGSGIELTTVIDAVIHGNVCVANALKGLHLLSTCKFINITGNIFRGNAVTNVTFDNGDYIILCGNVYSNYTNTSATNVTASDNIIG